MALHNLARMTSATTGAGTITLGAAVSGYLTFAQAGVVNGETVSYGIKDGANSEVGTAPYTASGTLLGPRTVTSSTNSNAAISLSGTAEVFITPRAEDLNVLPGLTNSLGADVALNNTANYFTGPSVAQGTVGTWLVTGTITLTSSTLDNFNIKLWDGTTVIASGFLTLPSAGFVDTVSLSGIISAPAGNIRFEAKDISSTNGKITFNSTGNSKDSTITVVRIA
jgi:hypothetical protein